MNTTIESETGILQSPYSQLLRNFLNEIDECMISDLSETDRFQNCFWLCVKWNKNLRELALMNGFKNSLEEIQFFRDIKPRFSCFTEFFVIVSEAVWFVNNKAECPSIFWKEEVEKYLRFCHRYAFFINYYESGNQIYDQEYFLRATAEAFSDIHSKMLDENPALRSSKDWLVRSYFAHKMYFGFVQDKLAEIKNSSKDQINNTIHYKSQQMRGRFSELLVSYLNSKPEEGI